MRSGRLLALALGIGSAGCGLIGSGVTRVYSGMEEVESTIPPDAYAHYLQGAHLESMGKMAEALIAYRRAIDSAPDSVELWTRLEAIECRAGSTALEEAFAQALALDAEYGPLLLARAECHAMHGDPRAALELAREAAAAMPDAPETTDLVAALFDRVGDRASAERWRSAWRLRAGDVRGRVPERSRLDDALDRDDLAAARIAAVKERLSTTELAFAAIDRGRARTALEQALLASRAEPHNADAWVALLVAADLARDEDRFREALKRIPKDVEPPGERARTELDELLLRRVLDPGPFSPLIGGPRLPP